MRIPFSHPKLLRHGVRGASSQGAGQTIGSIEDVVTVNEESAWFPVLGPDVEEAAIRVKDLDPAVATVGDVDAVPGVELEVVWIAESTWFSAL